MRTAATTIISAMMSAMIVMAVLSMVNMQSIIPEAVADGDGHSHFRFGHISWVPTGNPNEVEFTVLNAFRRDGYSGSAPDGSLAVGDTFLEYIGLTRLFFGDGSDTGVLTYKVVAVNIADNWVFARALDPITGADTIKHTYSSAGVYEASIDSCCRTFIEINNPASDYRVSTTVNLTISNRSPVSTIQPIVSCPLGPCSFTIPAADADGDALSFRLSTSSESGIGTHPPGASITPAGLYSADFTGATPGLYSTSVVIEESRGGQVIGHVMVDFLINAQPITVNNPPVFDVPPTPPSGTAYVINVGDTLTIPLQCSDPDAGDTVTIGHLGLPPGAVLVPPVPSGNPASGTFSWTPMAAGAAVVTFTCQDDNGASSLPHSFSITVIAPEEELEIKKLVTLHDKGFKVDESVSLLEGASIVEATLVGPKNEIYVYHDIPKQIPAEITWSDNAWRPGIQLYDGEWELKLQIIAFYEDPKTGEIKEIEQKMIIHFQVLKGMIVTKNNDPLTLEKEITIDPHPAQINGKIDITVKEGISPSVNNVFIAELTITKPSGTAISYTGIPIDITGSSATVQFPSSGWNAAGPNPTIALDEAGLYEMDVEIIAFYHDGTVGLHKVNQKLWISFNVIPEAAIGTIAMIGASTAILAVYAYRKKRA